MFSICSRAIFLISVCIQAYKKAKSTDPKCLCIYVGDRGLGMELETEEDQRTETCSTEQG